MMMAALWPVFDARLPKDLCKGGLAISGIYDLRPLVAGRLAERATCAWTRRAALQAFARVPADRRRAHR